jgi:hypothetical protein
METTQGEDRKRKEEREEEREEERGRGTGALFWIDVAPTWLARLLHESCQNIWHD